jgi:hypothetical protein
MIPPDDVWDEDWDAPLTQEQWNVVEWMFEDRDEAKSVWRDRDSCGDIYFQNSAHHACARNGRWGGGDLGISTHPLGSPSNDTLG